MSIEWLKVLTVFLGLETGLGLIVLVVINWPLTALIGCLLIGLLWMSCMIVEDHWS